VIGAQDKGRAHPRSKTADECGVLYRVALHGLGLDVSLFTPTFAVSRVSRWIAHALEQQRASRIIRPQSVYDGPHDRKWVPLPERLEMIVGGASHEPVADAAEAARVRRNMGRQ
jgi:hypothetical protein